MIDRENTAESSPALADATGPAHGHAHDHAEAGRCGKMPPLAVNEAPLLRVS
jgi:hypothetical protein